MLTRICVPLKATRARALAFSKATILRRMRDIETFHHYEPKMDDITVVADDEISGTYETGGWFR